MEQLLKCGGVGLMVNARNGLKCTGISKLKKWNFQLEFYENMSDMLSVLK